MKEIIDKVKFSQMIIFVSTSLRCEALKNLLNSVNIKAIGLHGKIKQDERLKLLKEIKANKHRIIISTDVLGRGIDFEKVNCVVNYDMTSDSDQFLHRVGRAGRFGTKGLVVTFIVGEKQGEHFNQIQSRFSYDMKEMSKDTDLNNLLSL